ncbi:MAG TPA: ABC transporter permease, partial [Pilimelia sp.]|nr:ABC transporter permease [Pilimelia sp.]
MTTAPEIPGTRSLPAWGGFSPTFVGLELRRMFRNRRTVIFTLIVPAVLFLLFGSGSAYRTEPLGRG